MPLPFLLWGAAALVGAIGVGAGLGAKSDLKEAKRIAEEAQSKHKAKIDKFNVSYDHIKSQAEMLAKTKLNVYETTVKSFLTAYKSLQKIKIHDVEYDDSFKEFNFVVDEIKEYEQQQINFVQTAISLTKAAGAGVSTGLGALGLVSSIGYASTGTAISGLSGVAATNATLAWFGGGSLAAGGLGIAGGVATLAGIVVAPALAVFGISMAIKADKALTEAIEYQAKVNESCEKIDLCIDFFNSLHLRIEEFIFVITEVNNRLINILPQINPIVSRVTNKKRKAEALRQIEIQKQQKAAIKKEKARQKALSRQNSKIWKLLFWIIKLFNKNYKPEDVPLVPYTFTLDPKFKTEILASEFLTEDDKKTLYQMKILGKSLKIILEMPLIDAEGKVNNESQEVIANVKSLLSNNNSSK